MFENIVIFIIVLSAYLIYLLCKKENKYFLGMFSFFIIPVASGFTHGWGVSKFIVSFLVGIIFFFTFDLVRKNWN